MADLPKVDKIWMDGELVDWDKAQVHVLTHALHYGSGVFEGIRCYATADGPAVFRLTEHMERFERSAKMLFMDLGYTVEEMVEAVKATIRVNKLPACYIRPIAFRGYGVMGLDPIPAPVNVSIACWEWETYMGEDALREGVDVGVSSWRQRGINSSPPAIKATGNYLNSRFARIEANQHGYNEAVMLNEEAKSRRARARTSSSSATASSPPRPSPTACSKASLATRSWSSPTTWAIRFSRSRSCARTSTPATRCS